MTAHRGNPWWLIAVVALLIEEIHTRLRSTYREHLLRGRRTITTFDWLLHSFLVPFFEESEVVLILASVVLFWKLKHLSIFLVVDFHSSNQRHRTDLRPSLTQNLASMAFLR
jgi:hypothetical protein